MYIAMAGSSRSYGKRYLDLLEGNCSHLLQLIVGWIHDPSRKPFQGLLLATDCSPEKECL